MSSWIKVHKLIKKPQILPINVNNINNNIFIPTFHILIATIGKPSLLNMLNSLKNELTDKDAISIIFDGKNTLSNSSFSYEWLNDHKSKINIIENENNLGYWGHGIRNKYQSILDPPTTFIMNADDDDEYIKGSFNKLRNICINPNILYIAKFYVKTKNITVPSQSNKIIQNDIGTPCGIIPFNIANKSNWEYRYGGDFDYYNNIQKYCKEIKFIDLIIYYVN